MSNNHVFLGFLPIFLDSFEIQSDYEVLCGFWDQYPFKCGVFCGEVVLFLARSYFSGIFWILRALFDLDLLL